MNAINDIEKEIYKDNKVIKDIGYIYITLVLISWLLSTIYQQNKLINRLDTQLNEQKIVIVQMDKDIRDREHIIQEQDKYSILLESKIGYIENKDKLIKELLRDR